MLNKLHLISFNTWLKEMVEKRLNRIGWVGEVGRGGWE